VVGNGKTRQGMGILKARDSMAKAGVTKISEPTNGGKETIDSCLPYTAHILPFPGELRLNKGTAGWSGLLRVWS
jgi:hypothetical protein